MLQTSHLLIRVCISMRKNTTHEYIDMHVCFVHNKSILKGLLSASSKYLNVQRIDFQEIYEGTT